jgi:3-oxoacyl-[acyl-carrier protein] reductase
MNTEGLPLLGRVALVSGGSGWIGSVIAAHLARAGAKVSIVYHRNDKAAERTIDAILADGGEACAVKGNITGEDTAPTVVRETEKQFGPVDILVNNALDTSVPWASIEEQRWSHHLAHLEYCVKAPLLLLQGVLPAMKDKGFGRVINIGSEAFDLGDANNGHYVAAKGAMLGLTRSWANELGPFGITVNTVVPGWVAREGHGFQDGEPIEVLRNYRRDLPIGRVGTPEDVATLTAFLCSEQAGFITGQRIAANGGKTRL